MAATIEENRLVKCPVCTSNVEEQKLGMLGLTKEELSILKVHIKKETFGKILQLSDILMKKITPDKLLKETETKLLFTKFGNLVENIDAKLGGTAIGKIGETITIKELKSAFPQDDFSDENANKGDTDIVATVVEGRIEKTKIAISCKYVDKWNSIFILQLQKNMKQEKTDYGLLVTKSFPSYALNDRVYYLEKEKIMMVKPEFLAVAYGGYRREVLAWDATQHYIKNRQQNEKEFSKSLKIITKWLNDRTNPILKCIETCKEISSQKEFKNRNLVKYIEKFENDLNKLEKETMIQVELIGTAMNDLDQVLKNEENLKC